MTVGISALGKFADLLGIVFTHEEQNTDENSKLTSPILNTLPVFTNDDNIKVSGFSPTGEKVEIYLDGDKVGEVILESGRFEYDLTLKTGENEIAARTTSGARQSELSSSVIVNFDKTVPKLEVTNPSEGQSFYGDNKVPVEGKTERDAQVFVNGFLANVDSDGNFDVIIPIPEGDSELEVKALDDAGNTNIVKISVNIRK
ncbi:MAG: hypothetical protein UU23_C0003G0038 [Candidatus Curtissbacteria bacterium GW2011_GWA1_40_9]|uniref:Bacillopeptidase F n=1 Tax=Candidatus Curtissbacteria bacterium GW2011_GWA1_40_9 TaxID=1618408 RepID=A0A0G0W1E7_9BACT|nr:MAG: hypothetical protein UU23_C0003G0038 [Candidatus Curtissbacteria bacterium GW2011_GWA1_40_9]